MDTCKKDRVADGYAWKSLCRHGVIHEFDLVVECNHPYHTSSAFECEHLRRDVPKGVIGVMGEKREV